MSNLPNHHPQNQQAADLRVLHIYCWHNHPQCGQCHRQDIMLQLTCCFPAAHYHQIGVIITIFLPRIMTLIGVIVYSCLMYQGCFNIKGSHIFPYAS